MDEMCVSEQCHVGVDENTDVAFKDRVYTWICAITYLRYVCALCDATNS